jgi:hypothetical protein
MQIPVAQNFAFSSPAFKAPSRYFDSLILKYQATESEIKAKIYWRYDDMTEFDETHSQSVSLKKSDQWTRERVDLTESKNWDKGKTITQIKIEILSPSNQKLATISPETSGTQPISVSGQVLFNYIIFDRNSFSDTFER